MSSEVAALPFQEQANYGTWSMDFDFFTQKCTVLLNIDVNYKTNYFM